MLHMLKLKEWKRFSLYNPLSKTYYNPQFPKVRAGMSTQDLPSSPELMSAEFDH